MFSEALNKRKELHSKIGSDFDDAFELAVKKISKALESSKERGLINIGFSGNDGGKMSALCDVCFIAPEKKTALKQEIHTILGHEICSTVEKELFFTNN